MYEASGQRCFTVSGCAISVWPLDMLLSEKGQGMLVIMFPFPLDYMEKPHSQVSQPLLFVQDPEQAHLNIMVNGLYLYSTLPHICTHAHTPMGGCCCM